MDVVSGCCRLLIGERLARFFFLDKAVSKRSRILGGEAKRDADGRMEVFNRCLRLGVSERPLVAAAAALDALVLSSLMVDGYCNVSYLKFSRFS